jgi:putative SOS response-associated peptidase YedK
MCSNYRPVTSLDRLLAFFGVERTRNEPPPDVDVYPLGLAPFIRLDPDGDPRDTSRPLVAENAVFGLLPEFATELVYGRKTYNARSETVHTLPSFKAAWAAGQRCIIPAECIYEPSYETGRAVWWRIAQPGSVPMGVAGIYREWKAPDGSSLFTMAMLTVNADDHPVMKRFHKPREEKRMVVVLDPSEYGPWLTCPVADARRYFKQWHGPLETTPRELEQRARQLGETPDLF